MVESLIFGLICGLCIFLIPGILVINKKYDLIKNLVYIFAFSLSFWIVFAWFMKIFKLPLTLFFYAIIILTLVIFLFRFDELKKIKKEYVILLFFIGVLFVRLIPFFTLTAQPLYGDATFHALTARLIVENDGLPDSYQPLLPINNFGLYVPGFHTISALISLLGGIEVYRSTLLLSCIIYFLIISAFYVFLREYFKRSVSLITALIAGCLTTYPQMIFHWGGNPTALGFLFAFMAFLILKGIDKKISVGNLLLSSFFVVGSFLSQSNPFLVLFYILFFYATFLILSKRWAVARNMSYLGLFCLLLVIPFFYSIGFDMSNTKEESFGMELGELRHSIATTNLLLLIPVQAIGYTSLLLVILSVIGWVIMDKNIDWLKYTAVLFFITVLMINSKYHILPFSDVLSYLDRISLFFLIPFLYFSAGIIERIERTSKKTLMVLVGLYLIVSLIYLVHLGGINFERSPYNFSFQKRTNIGIKDSINAVLFQNLLGAFALYTFGFGKEVVLTQSDLDAMEWIKRNTYQKDLFLNNDYDAGKWIPAIAYRPVLKPHASFFASKVEEYYNLEHFRVDYEDLKERGVKYIYLGKKNIVGQGLTPITFENNDYTKVYDKDGVKIYKVIY